ncbi:hypothetical protein EC845_2536 [Comamonas sp. BIGb0124]|uniref:hypothetical protein n=1 Tax=Comamonas sp. BIGb0124 TaxID=2485130 RepID=UPI000FAFDB44|nr:hypothetical protein [Comamonas sp. BIGb0124]ROR21714.1 hypothetical protein EC845_2536 [Comamonas sp. BIGb0124]
MTEFDGITDDESLRLIMQSPVNASKYLGFVWRLIYSILKWPQGEEVFWQRRKSAKYLQDEMVPLAYFVRDFFAYQSDVAISWVSGSQQHDAVVTPKTRDVGFIEITCLQDYRERKRRDEMLAFGEYRASSCLDDEVERCRQLLKDVITNKSKKEYPQGTALVIYSTESLGLPIFTDSICEVCTEQQEQLAQFQVVCVRDAHRVHYERSLAPP